MGHPPAKSRVPRRRRSREGAARASGARFVRRCWWTWPNRQASFLFRALAGNDDYTGTIGREVRGSGKLSPRKCRAAKHAAYFRLTRGPLIRTLVCREPANQLLQFPGLECKDAIVYPLVLHRIDELLRFIDFL